MLRQWTWLGFGTFLPVNNPFAFFKLDIINDSNYFKRWIVFSLNFSLEGLRRQQPYCGATLSVFLKIKRSKWQLWDFLGYEFIVWPAVPKTYFWAHRYVNKLDQPDCVGHLQISLQTVSFLCFFDDSHLSHWDDAEQMWT